MLSSSRARQQWRGGPWDLPLVKVYTKRVSCVPVARSGLSTIHLPSSLSMVQQRDGRSSACQLALERSTPHELLDSVVQDIQHCLLTATLHCI